MKAQIKSIVGVWWKQNFAALLEIICGLPLRVHKFQRLFGIISFQVSTWTRIRRLYWKSPDFLTVFTEITVCGSTLQFSDFCWLRYIVIFWVNFLCHPIIDYNKQLEFSWGKRNRSNIFRIPGGNSSYISFMNKRSMKSMVFAHSWFVYELRF